MIHLTAMESSSQGELAERLSFQSFTMPVLESDHRWTASKWLCRGKLENGSEIKETTRRTSLKKTTTETSVLIAVQTMIPTAIILWIPPPKWLRPIAPRTLPRIQWTWTNWCQSPIWMGNSCWRRSTMSPVSLNICTNSWKKEKRLFDEYLI